MHRHDDLGARRDRRFDQVDVDQVVVPHIDKGRNPAELGDGERAGDIGVRRHDHLVAPADPKRLEGDFEGGRTGLDPDAMQAAR